MRVGKRKGERAGTEFILFIFSLLIYFIHWAQSGMKGGRREGGGGGRKFYLFYLF